MMNLKEMTNQELEQLIDELETKRFMLAMADHWDASDYDYDRKWFNQIQLAKKELAERVTA